MDEAIKLIKKYSPLAQISENRLEELETSFYDLSVENKPAITALISYAKILKPELFNEKGSSADSPGQSAINEAFEYLSKVIYEHYCDESDLKALKPLYDELMNTFISAYEGNYVTSGNVEAVKKIVNMQNYLEYTKETLKSNDLKRLMKGICQDYRPRPNDKNMDSWKDDLYYSLNEIFENVSIEELRKCKPEIINGLLFWAEVGMNYNSDDESTEYLLEFMSNMCRVFENATNTMSGDDDNLILFQGIDAKTLDSCLSRSDKIMSAENFAPNRYPQDMMEFLIQSCLSNFIKETSDTEILGKVYAFYNKFASSSNRSAEDIASDMKETFEEKMASIDFEAIGMKSALDQFLDDIRGIKHEDEVHKVVSKYEKHFESAFLPKLKNDMGKMKEFIQVLIENPYYAICRDFFGDYVDSKKLFSLKTNPELLNFIFDNMYNAKFEYSERYTDSYFNISQNTIQLLDKEKLVSKTKKDLYNIIERAFDFTKHPYHNACQCLIYKVDWKGEIERFVRIIKKLRKLVEADNTHFEDKDVIVQITTNVIEYTNYNNNGKNKKYIEHADCFADLFNYCAKVSWLIDSEDEILEGKDLDEDERRTLAGTILINLMQNIYQPNNDFDDFIKPIVGTLKELKKQEDDETIQEKAKELINELTDQMELLGSEAGADIIQEFLQDRDITLLDKISKMYPTCDKEIYNNLDEISEIVEESGDYALSYYQVLLNKIADTNPGKINQKAFDYIISVLDTVNGIQFFFLLQKLAPKRFELFQNHHAKIQEVTLNGEHGGAFLQLLADLSQTKDLAEANAKIAWKICQRNDATYSISAYYSLRSIALRFKEVVEVYKPELEALKDNPKLRDSVMAILDVLEGRTLENVANDVEEQREDIDQLDTRVTNNEDKIENLDNDVRETKEDVANVKQDVKETKERIDQIEYTIKGLDERVEELGHMTLSHAPAWSRHVSELMNDQTDNDWRLLAMKLNYTNDDIRNWATQPDPCLSMLDEWFATHKTREATFAILNNLKEMNRLDAAEIVETALASVKDVVKDDEDEEFEKPEIFLSYQWGHQQEVKLLRKHLEMAGFKAWMDIGQMGGGDKLYAKIDDGVRSAKLIISCVSEKYAKSANCCREVNLSTNLGKPMIPILMEQLAWPPAGPMGPIMSEYLYIRFFKSGGMQEGDSIFWMPAKFQELLMQIRYYVVPEMKLITDDSPYKGWTNPPEEEIIIPKREQKAIKSQSGKSEGEQQEEIAPDVFISYQWGKQPQIKRLYRKLSEMGYYCWLDIMQMGGGDSLFDKIDRGIRGAKVVISCVTPKYALSANCRREVSLSGALSKPIIPLLLEDMKWPPEGPMSMTFTELLYIGFHRKKDEVLWQGDEFSQLISKIDLNAPGCRIDEKKELKEEEQNGKLAEEGDQKKKLQEDDDRKRKLQEEEDRKRKLGEEEEDRKRKSQEEEDRKRKLLEEEDRKRKLQEEEDRKRKLQEEEDRKRKLQEEEDRKKKLEEENRRKQIAEQEAQKRKASEKSSSTCSLL